MALFCSVDYDSFELKSWAQVCLWTVGFSRMAEVLNAGRDPHTELGADLAGITVDEAYRLVKDPSSNFKEDHRQTGKIGNFGLPGGMGAKTLRTQARTEYKVILSLPRSYELKEKWGNRWQESTPYFEFINRQMRGPRDQSRATIKHFISNRIRANIPYTVACNTYFQGLAADAATAAGFALSYAMYCDTSSPVYGSRLVNFVHDEFIAEVPEHPERAHLAAYGIRDIVVATAQQYMPDLKITAEPALMRRWYKKAGTVINNGLLVPWEPS